MGVLIWELVTIRCVDRLKLTFIRGLGFTPVSDKNGRVYKILVRESFSSLSRPLAHNHLYLQAPSQAKSTACPSKTVNQMKSTLSNCGTSHLHSMFTFTLFEHPLFHHNLMYV